MSWCPEGVEAAETRSTCTRDGVEGADMIKVVEEEGQRVVCGAVTPAVYELSTCPKEQWNALCGGQSKCGGYWWVLGLTLLYFGDAKAL